LPYGKEDEHINLTDFSGRNFVETDKIGFKRELNFIKIKTKKQKKKRRLNHEKNCQLAFDNWSGYF